MKAASSLTRVIITRVVAILLVFTVCRFIIVDSEIGSLLDEVRSNIVTGWLWEVGSYIRKDDKNNVVLQIPEIRAELFTEPGIDYIVRDEQGKMLFHAPDPWVDYTPPKTPDPNSIYEFNFTGPDGRPYIGQSRWIVFDGKRYLVQVTLSTDYAGKFPDRLRRMFLYKYGSLSVLFFGLLILSVLFSIRQSLKAVSDTSRAAQKISFATPESRLPADRLPAEINPLVEAFNRVLDRLEAGITAQKEFTAHAAHELRTPLSLLQSQIDLLEDKGLKAKLSGSVKIMRRLVEQLLAAAKLEHADGMEMKNTDLAVVVRDVCLELWPMMINQSVRLEVSGTDEPVWVQGNGDSIGRALRNVLENALRHSPKDAVINVDLAEREIRVRDHGPGVADEDKAHVFEIFWRKDTGSSDGAGIGLYIVQVTMKLHGGSVRVEDAPNGGSVFLLSFPS